MRQAASEPPLPQPKAGDGVVFCEHLAPGGGPPTLRGGFVIKIDAPEADFGPDEIPHGWLVVCRVCKKLKDKDMAHPIPGFHYTWPQGLVFTYGNLS